MQLTLPLNIEIPSSPTDFYLGLMFRESLEQDSGMFFVFEESGEKSFHMKDTTIPLDVAFINKDGIIESIKELEPLNVIPVYSDADVLYALEVNRGWFVEHNVKVGDKIFLGCYYFNFSYCICIFCTTISFFKRTSLNRRSKI